MRTKPDIQQAIVLREAGWTLSSIVEKRDICAVTLARFTGKKGANISPQIIFLDDSIARHLAILGAEYRKNSSEPVFRQ